MNDRDAGYSVWQPGVFRLPERGDAAVAAQLQAHPRIASTSGVADGHRRAGGQRPEARLAATAKWPVAVSTAILSSGNAVIEQQLAQFAWARRCFFNCRLYGKMRYQATVLLLNSGLVCKSCRSSCPSHECGDGCRQRALPPAANGNAVENFTRCVANCARTFAHVVRRGKQAAPTPDIRHVRTVSTRGGSPLPARSARPASLRAPAANQSREGGENFSVLRPA